MYPLALLSLPLLSYSLSVPSLQIQQPLGVQVPAPFESLDTTSAIPGISKELEAWISANPEIRWVEYEKDGAIVRRKVKEGEKALLTLELNGGTFVDVTKELEEGLVGVQDLQGGSMWKEGLKTHYTRKDFQAAFDAIPSEDELKEFLTKFSSFRTRHYRTSTGAEASKYLQTLIKDTIKQSKLPKELYPTVEAFSHSWDQESVIVKFPTQPTSEKVIIGAHLDSTNFLPWLTAPGADDDGSGTTSILGAFHGVLNLLENGWSLNNETGIEFHWYSAEEGGLLGSQDISRAYAKKGELVRGMVQIDMTGFVDNLEDETIGIFDDNVNLDLTDFIEKIISIYSDIPSKRTSCGYGCSDHASWTKVGAASCAITENVFERTNKNIHSARDTITQTGFSWKHIREFSKIVAAWGVELAGWEKP